METREQDVAYIDGNITNNHVNNLIRESSINFFAVEEYGHEIELAAQEWGIKEGLRLFGFTSFEAVPKPGVETLMMIGYFIDTAFKNMTKLYFTVKEKKGKIAVVRAKAKELNAHFDKGWATDFKWPIKILRTDSFITKDILPVRPLYQVLLSRGIILPFQSTMKSKDWLALPFEDGSGIEPTEI
ncbi:MAG: hypothetical protein LBH43_20560 [Treponema sp.]|jgi:hypothetical protein|nr:hypothetical protein [Treponema sp.]